jgi:hypothetical protein
VEGPARTVAVFPGQWMEVATGPKCSTVPPGVLQVAVLEAEEKGGLKGRLSCEQRAVLQGAMEVYRQETRDVVWRSLENRMCFAACISAT